jgi:hypothetical protein
MIDLEIIKFEKGTNKPIAKKIMSSDNWIKFKKFTEFHYYKSYQLGFSQYNL